MAGLFVTGVQVAAMLFAAADEEFDLPVRKIKRGRHDKFFRR
jgi:hypothetical protein